MIVVAWIAWFLLALPWFVVDGWIASHLRWGPDLTVVLALVAGLHVRPGAVAAFLFCAASARALVVDGSLPLHFLALGLPVAFLVAARRVFVERSLLLHVSAALFLATTTPRLTGFLGRLTDDVVAVPDVDGAAVLRAVVWGPVLALLVASMPPWRAFRTPAERSSGGEHGPRARATPALAGGAR